MGLRTWCQAGNAALLVAVGALWLASGTQHEKAVLAESHNEAVRALEVQVAMAPGDAMRRRDLAQAYLDVHAPGLAVGVVESAPAAVRTSPLIEHVYARALLDEGRSVDALAAERRVLARCAPSADDESPCDTWLLASATRRADILRELVDLGVDDAQAHPEASAIAYHNATREARLAAPTAMR
jgi:hypothetical protein